MANLADGHFGTGEEHALRAADDARLGRAQSDEQKEMRATLEKLASALKTRERI
jgi:hypothetical protein